MNDLMREDSTVNIEVGSVWALVINFEFKSIVKEYGWLKTIWGYDIFLNKVPFLKSLVLANIIIWIIISLGS